MKRTYHIPVSEEVRFELQGLVADSYDGTLEDMPGDFVIDD